MLMLHFVILFLVKIPVFYLTFRKFHVVDQ